MIEQTAEEWLEEELIFINEKMSHTLNARMQAKLHSVDEQAQELTLEFPLLDWEVNGLGTLHGGMMSTMLDLTMSMVIYCFSRQTIPPTISQTMNFLRPVPMNGSVLIKARVTSCGRKNATAYGEAIIPESRKVACTSIGTYAIIPKKPEA